MKYMFIVMLFVFGCGKNTGTCEEVKLTDSVLNSECPHVNHRLVFENNIGICKCQQ